MNSKLTTLAAATGLALLVAGSPAMAAPPPPEVVLLFCSGSTNNTGNYKVLEFSATVGAPAINIGDQCADALASLLTAGFKLNQAALAVSVNPSSQHLLIK